MREEKQLLLDEIEEKIESSSGFIVTSYKNLTAAKIRDFRDKLSAAGADFEVVRKRVFVKAAEKRGINIDPETLAGHIGIVFTKDEFSVPTKFLMNFSQQNEDAIAILKGHVDGELLSGEDVLAIATLPSLQELRALFVGVIQAPMTHMLGVINEVLAGVPRCLDQKSNKSE